MLREILELLLQALIPDVDDVDQRALPGVNEFTRPTTPIDYTTIDGNDEQEVTR
jgi:hypothetical protein